jgi:hypothetical protein
VAHNFGNLVIALFDRGNLASSASTLVRMFPSFGTNFQVGHGIPTAHRFALKFFLYPSLLDEGRLLLPEFHLLGLGEYEIKIASVPTAGQTHYRTINHQRR